MAKTENIVYYGTGRRKSSVARVRLVEGSGKITINGKNIDEFFGLETLNDFIARALNEANIEYRPALKSNGFLTRDPRMKERKKYGLKKARKAPQFSKR